MTPSVSIPNERRLTMQYAGGLVKHLGLSMYRGAVPALAELLANAWDADAAEVRVAIPLDVGGLKNEQIVVADDGHGMSWEDVQHAYLLVGRDRRRAQGETSPSGRTVMGRKGLGKLAGFGIARVVEVRTVKNGSLTHFSMDFADMTKDGQAQLVEAYEPEVLADEATNEPNGTRIVLKQLQLTNAVSGDRFRQAMARRFSILQAGFQVFVNDEPLAPYAPDLQFRFQGDGGGWEEVLGVGSVKWWMGFTEKPIQNEALRGVSILVREKMAQAPFFFEISGGTHAQAGLQYLTGEVHVDQLDEDKDFIGTDRQGVLWAEPMPAALLSWGQEKVRELLSRWVEQRRLANEKQLAATVARLGGDSVSKRISRLRPSEQKEAQKVIRELASIESVTDEPDRARDLLDLVLRAFEDSSFFSLLRALSAVDQAQREEVLRLVTELDIFEVIKLAEVVRARVGVIHKFQDMISADVPEKPDMQEFLFRHPWLINPEWVPVEHEKRLEKLVIDRFNLDPQADPESERRVDFFCIGQRGRFLVVEVKRPGKVLGQKEITQTMDYVSYLRQQAPTSGPGLSPNHYEGILVGHHVSPDAGVRWRDIAAKDGVTVQTWTELLEVAERIHRQFLETMKRHAPEDARIRGLPEIPTNGVA